MQVRSRQYETKKGRIEGSIKQTAELLMEYNVKR